MAKVMLQNVTKQYGDYPAVRDLSFIVNDGEFFVIVGPSGCGKTTVLRLIAGLEIPTAGSIYIGDRLVNNMHPHERRVAMVFESPTFGLFPHMTAYDNMAFGLRFRKDRPDKTLKHGAGAKPVDSENAGQKEHPSNAEKEADIKQRVESVAGRLGLAQYLHRKQAQLSSGHNQSLALGRSMVQNPDVFLMDCPLAQVDPVNRMTARAELRRRHREVGITTIYVTHDQEEAVALGDHIAVMDEGTMPQIGTAQTLYAHPATAFVAGFIGSPPMNLLPARIDFEDEKGADGEMFLAGKGFRVPVPSHLALRLSSRAGSNILLGLRPDAIGDPHYLTVTDPRTLVEGRVVAREYTGSDVFLHVALHEARGLGQEVVARVHERTAARVFDNFTVAFDMDQLFAFDQVTGKTLL